MCHQSGFFVLFGLVCVEAALSGIVDTFNSNDQHKRERFTTASCCYQYRSIDYMTSGSYQTSHCFYQLEVQYVRPKQDTPLHLISHTPLVNPDPHHPLSITPLATPFCRLLKCTLTWVVMGSRHLDIVEGDRERSQREHVVYLRDLSTLT